MSQSKNENVLLHEAGCPADAKGWEGGLDAPPMTFAMMIFCYEYMYMYVAVRLSFVEFLICEINVHSD